MAKLQQQQQHLFLLVVVVAVHSGAAITASAGSSAAALDKGLGYQGRPSLLQERDDVENAIRSFKAKKERLVAVLKKKHAVLKKRQSIFIGLGAAAAGLLAISCLTGHFGGKRAKQFGPTPALDGVYIGSGLLATLTFLTLPGIAFPWSSAVRAKRAAAKEVHDVTTDLAEKEKTARLFDDLLTRQFVRKDAEGRRTVQQQQQQQSPATDGLPVSVGVNGKPST